MSDFPKLKYPKYTTQLLSTGEDVEYRPWTAGEEKIMLMALESDAISDQTKCIKDVLEACTFKKHDVEKWATFDIDWMFLRVRERSVGETSSIVLNTRCEKDGKPCDSQVTLTIKLDDVKVVTQNKTGKEVAWSPSKNKDVHQVVFDSGIGVSFRYPTYRELVNIPKEFTGDQATEFLTALCVVNTFDEEQVYDSTNIDPKRTMEFLSELDKPSVEKINQFFSTIPELIYDCKVKCPNCGQTENHRFTGIKDFFD